jgi:hypothetical protein
MKLLDFLSNSPKYFIFEKDSNKTTFGGVLTIIYLIALLIIAFIFIYNYETNNKYIITYGHYQRSVSYEEREHLSNDPKYNLTLEFIFKLEDLQNITLSDNFIILDYQNGKIIERNKPIEYKVSDLYIAVLYKCQDQNCSPQPEDIKQFPLNLAHYFIVESTYFNYDLLDKNEPIIKKDGEYQGSMFLFNLFTGHLIDNFWQVIKVTEEKGIIESLFGLEEKTNIGGNFYKNDVYCISNDPAQFPGLDGLYRPLLIFNGYNEFTDYIEYKRKRISIFDIIANIFSLALALFNGFTFAFKFLYSNNFDNYKIIDKILSKNNITFKKIKNINEDSDNDSPPLLNELKNVDDYNKESDKENDVDKKLIENKNIKEGAIPKFHFFDFIYNTFYLNFCKRNKTQECISTCMEISKRYNSIENIIYNQFMIENLLKDYKWNNPRLNSIKNIELINKLNMIITEEN